MKTKKNTFLVMSAIVAALGGLLFGFDTAVISGTTPFIQSYFKLSDIGLGWAVSSILIGAIVGVASARWPGDVFGRRKTLMLAAVFFIISAIGSALSKDLETFVFFRFFGGLAVGAASMLSPMYISEIAPKKYRGRLVSLNQLAIVIGILVAFFSNYLLSSVGENNWRWMLGIMCIPAAIFLLSLTFVPDSPRWLVLQYNFDEALRILVKINGEDIAIKELESIKQSVQENKSIKFSEVFSKRMRPILLIGVLLAVFQQATGINSIMYYAPIIFQKAGSELGSSLMQTIIIGGVNLLFTLLAIRLIDKIGRKRLLLIGASGMIFSLSVISFLFFMNYQIEIILLLFTLLYIASFAVALGPVTWVVISEIFPNKLRSAAMSVAILALWLTCFFVTLLFPVMLNRLGGGGSFLVFNVASIMLLFFIIYKIPETKGKSLEEIEHLLYKE